MRNGLLRIPVYILEDSDVDGVDDDARVSGGLQGAAKALQDVLPKGRGVQMALRSDPRRGVVGVALIDGIKLAPGDGIAFHPTFPGGAVRVDAALLVGDETEDEEVEDEGDADVEEAVVAPTPAKKTSKKATKKAST